MGPTGAIAVERERWPRWLVWGAANAALYAALVTPQPAQFANQVLPAEAVFSASKLVHVTAYAVLAVLSGWLRLPGRWRWLLLAWLSLHAVSTEFIQQFVPGRGPSLFDVGFDHLGILLGVALTWRWWQPASIPAPPAARPRSGGEGNPFSPLAPEAGAGGRG